MFSPDTSEPAKEVFCAKILHNRFPFKLKRCSCDELIFKFRISNGPRLSGRRNFVFLPQMKLFSSALDFLQKYFFSVALNHRRVFQKYRDFDLMDGFGGS